MSSTADVVKHLLSGFAGQQNTLTIPRPFLTWCNNDHLAALLLSQCVYWTDRTKDPNGWFAKSYKEWHAELGMTERQVRRAVPVLKSLGLQSVLRRSPFHEGAATLHYRLDIDVLAERVLTLCQNGNLQNVRTDPDEMSERSFTEPISKPIKKAAGSRTRKAKKPVEAKSIEEPQRPAVYALYEQNIGMLTPHLAEQLKSASTDYPAGWLEDAIKLATERNVRKWTYVRGILTKWKTNGRDAVIVEVPKPSANGKSSEKVVYVPIEPQPLLPVLSPEQVEANRARLHAGKQAMLEALKEQAV